MQPTSPDSQKKKPVEDDRNIVVVDKDFSDADIEDRVWLFWKRNRTTIIGIIAVVVVVTLSFSVYDLWKSQRAEKVQNAYLSAENPQALAAFAEQYKGEALAAVAALQLADDAYRAEQYDKAAGLYAEAVPALKPAPELQQRARLGEAVSVFLAGKDPKAEKLTAFAQDGTVYDAYRAQADYQLALIAVEAKDFLTARSWLEQLASLTQSGVWAERAQTLVALKPEILKADRTVPAAK